MMVWALSLLGLLAAVMPSFQQFQDHLFHLLGRVAFWEIPMQLFAGERYPVKLAFLLFGHDGAHHVNGQMTFLAEFLQPLLVEVTRLERATSCSQSKHSTN